MNEIKSSPLDQWTKDQLMEFAGFIQVLYYSHIGVVMNLVQHYSRDGHSKLSLCLLQFSSSHLHAGLCPFTWHVAAHSLSVLHGVFITYNQMQQWGVYGMQGCTV